MTGTVDSLHLSICSCSHLPVTHTHSLSIPLSFTASPSFTENCCGSSPPPCLQRRTCSPTFRASELSRFDFPDDTSYAHPLLSSNFYHSETKRLLEGTHFLSIRAQPCLVLFAVIWHMHGRAKVTIPCQ